MNKWNLSKVFFIQLYIYKYTYIHIYMCTLPNKNKLSSNKAYSIDKSKITQADESCNLKYMKNIQSLKVVSNNQNLILNIKCQRSAISPTTH